MNHDVIAGCGGNGIGCPAQSPQPLWLQVIQPVGLGVFLLVVVVGVIIAWRKGWFG